MLGIKETLIKILTDIKTIKDSLTTLNNKFDSGTWVPHLYDNTTLVRLMPTSRWWRIGDLVIMYIIVDNFNWSNVSTMIQIRNFPFSGTIMGGTAYFAGLNNRSHGGTVTIQASSAGVYFRPNIKSSDFTNATTGRSTFLFFGIRNIQT